MSGIIGNVTGIQTFSLTNSFTVVNANSGSEQTVTVPGVVYGRDEVLRIHKSTHQAGLTLVAWVSADNTVKVRFSNATGSNITPTSGDTYTLTVLRHESVIPTTGACFM